MTSLAVRHAWLQMTAHKRKAEDELYPPPKRMQALEQSMSDMTLARIPMPNRSPPTSLSHTTAAVVPMEMEVESHNTSPENDVRMKRQTWYEPEKDRE
jgi:hypothetical protein